MFPPLARPPNRAHKAYVRLLRALGYDAARGVGPPSRAGSTRWAAPPDAEPP